MLDNDRARRIVLIAERVESALVKLARLRHAAFGDFDLCHVLWLIVLLGLDQQPQIRGIGKQAPFAGLYWIGEALTCKHLVFEHAEAAAIERERTGISHPQRAQRPT